MLVLNHMRLGVDLEPANHVGIRSRVTPRGRGAGHSDTDGLAIVKPPHTAGLPTAQEAVHDRIQVAAPMLASSEGDLPDVAELEHLRDVPFGERALQFQLLGSRNEENPPIQVVLVDTDASSMDLELV